MTRKDYKLIAQCIKEARQEALEALNRGNPETTNAIIGLQCRLSLALGERNPRFDPLKFSDACLPEY